jgi:predicted small metal-binding protein
VVKKNQLKSLKIKIMKQLNCCDAGFDCPAVVRAKTEEEVLAQAAQHALDAHGVTVTPEMAAQIKTLITDVVETA